MFVVTDPNLKFSPMLLKLVIVNTDPNDIEFVINKSTLPNCLFTFYNHDLLNCVVTKQVLDNCFPKIRKFKFSLQ